MGGGHLGFFSQVITGKAREILIFMFMSVLIFVPSCQAKIRNKDPSNQDVCPKPQRWSRDRAELRLPRGPGPLSSGVTVAQGVR